MITEELQKNQNIGDTKEYYLEMIKIFLDHIESKRNTYISIMINNRNSIMFDIVYDVLDHDIKSRLKNFNMTFNLSFTFKLNLYVFRTC